MLVIFHDTEEKCNAMGLDRARDNSRIMRALWREGSGCRKSPCTLQAKRDGQFDEEARLEELAGEIGVTLSYFCRVLKNMVGVIIGANIKEFERELSKKRIKAQSVIAQQDPVRWL